MTRELTIMTNATFKPKWEEHWDRFAQTRNYICELEPGLWLSYNPMDIVGPLFARLNQWLGLSGDPETAVILEDEDRWIVTEGDRREEFVRTYAKGGREKLVQVAKEKEIWK